MNHHAIRVSVPYADMAHIIDLWAEKSSFCVAYEHYADEEDKTAHVHIGLYNTTVKAEALKRMWKDAPGKGNEFWSWKEASPIDIDWCVDELKKANADLDKIRLNKELKYLIYMAKGCLLPKFNKRFSNSILEYSRQNWVEPVKADKPGDHSERVIREILEQFKNEKFKTTYSLNDMEDEGLPINVIHTRVRKAVFRKLWGEHRRVPHASFFKIVADSAFLRICERLDRFEEGMSAVLNIES